MSKTIEFRNHVLLAGTRTFAFRKEALCSGWGNVVLKRMLLRFDFTIDGFGVVQTIGIF